MQKYTEALELNPDLIYEVKSLQYRAGIQMAKLATEANEFEEIQLAIRPRICQRTCRRYWRKKREAFN